MKNLVSKINIVGYDRIILVEDSLVGIYVFVYETAQSKNPEQDHLQDDLAMAKRMCSEDFGVPLDSWMPTDDGPN